MAPIKIAVLDDYQGISEPHFTQLDSISYDVTIFKDTLLPYNHPDTPQNVKDELVKRLEPFIVICTSPFLPRSTCSLSINILRHDERTHPHPP